MLWCSPMCGIELSLHQWFGRVSLTFVSQGLEPFVLDLDTIIQQCLYSEIFYFKSVSISFLAIFKEYLLLQSISPEQLDEYSFFNIP